MNHLFSKHISEIGQQKEPIKKFAKGNVVPQKRLSLDVSATLFNKGDIGAGREDFWIIGVDKNGTKTWKPLGLKDDFKLFKEETLMVFDGSQTISFCINKNFVLDQNLKNGICINIYNLASYSITLEFVNPRLGGLQCAGMTADEMYTSFAKKIDDNNEYSFIENAMPDAFEDGTIDTTYNYLKNSSERKLKTFFYYLRLLVEFAYKIENKYYKTTKSQISSKAENKVNEDLIKNYLMKLQTQSTINNLLTPAEQIEEYRKKFLANPIIDNLPPFLKGVAINEQIAQGNSGNENLSLAESFDNGGFKWNESLYTFDVWYKISNGKWDDATLKAFAPNMEDLLSPPPSFLNVSAQIEAYRKKFIDKPIIDNLPPLIKGIAINEQIAQWSVSDANALLGGAFSWSDTLQGTIIWGNIEKGKWDDPTLIAFAPNMEDLLSPPPQYVPQTEPPLINQKERIFSDEELEKLIQERGFSLDDFKSTKIRIANTIQSTNFQNLIFKLGGGWSSKDDKVLDNRKLSYLYISGSGTMLFGNEEETFEGTPDEEIEYVDIFSNLLFPLTKEIQPIASLVEEPKMPISKDILKLKEEYEDLMFLIEVTPKVDIVAITELKQRAYDLKKEIDLLHLKRTDELMQSNNIFQKLFESSSVEPIYRYDLTPEPNGFAPDGTPTKLPKNIYDLCQTNDFLDWFGNFKNAYNYRNSPYEVPCSIVRTEHYEPKVVFHGTGAEFSYFDFNKFPAMYFAENFSYAEWFAEQKGAQMGGHIGYVYPFLLNIKNYLDLTDFGINEISFEEFSDTIFLQTGLDSSELEINPALISSNKPVWAWVYLRNSPEFLKKLRDMKLFDGIVYYEQNPPINPTAPNYMTKGFIIFEPQNAKIVATNRKELLLPSMRSFYLKKGGKV